MCKKQQVAYFHCLLSCCLLCKEEKRNCNCYPKDKADDDTIDSFSLHNSERDARNFARQKLGRNPVKIEAGKWRSRDGKWQYRAKPNDLAGHPLKNQGNTEPRIHLARLNPETGRVIRNYHLGWKE